MEVPSVTTTNSRSLPDDVDHTAFFTDMYTSLDWGSDQSPDYNGSSGDGQRDDCIKKNEIFINFMRKFITQNNIRRVADLGCGTMFAMSEVMFPLDKVAYHGYDVYRDVINHNILTHRRHKFSCVDVLKNLDSVERADMFVMTNVLQHWTRDEIVYFLDTLIDSQKCKYLIINNSGNQQHDDQDWSCRSNPLSIHHQPLKSYDFKYLFRYDADGSDRQVSMLIMNR